MWEGIKVGKDRFHDVVRTALEKEGWTITADPYELNVGDVDFEIDLAADMLLAAERQGEKIAVEVKSFIGRSAVSDFHTALGQCINYQFALEEVDPERQLYLAVPDAVYRSFFQRRFIQSVIQRTQLKLFTYDEIQEVIGQWL
ncbi:MAG: fatty-acid oxidation protein subunit alpha [Cyanothece sp. SIO2G6]|nr:fatty-acid oxidation protein subunit alpha [Cyanothece sp. SIO2G6]